MSVFSGARKGAYTKSDDATVSREQRMARLKSELRDHIRLMADYEILSTDWCAFAVCFRGVFVVKIRFCELFAVFLCFSCPQRWFLAVSTQIEPHTNKHTRTNAQDDNGSKSVSNCERCIHGNQTLTLGRKPGKNHITLTQHKNRKHAFTCTHNHTLTRTRAAAAKGQEGRRHAVGSRARRAGHPHYPRGVYVCACVFC